uniref:Uncharacterized protein n=1 Tax=Glossina morsitans morsitans TaxID=37546 RepID=A0A1B0FIH9_GLOMM
MMLIYMVKRFAVFLILLR